MMGITYEQARELFGWREVPPHIARRLGGKEGWSGRAVTVREAKEAGVDFEDVMSVARGIARKDADVERRLRLLAADCAAHVLPIYERQHPGDSRPREAIIAARQYTRGEIDKSALVATWDRAWAAARKAADDTGAKDAAWTAWDASGIAGGDVSAWVGITLGATSAAWDASSDAKEAAETAEIAEREWQYERLAEWFDDPEPDDWPLDNGREVADVSTQPPSTSAQPRA